MLKSLSQILILENVLYYFFMLERVAQDRMEVFKIIVVTFELLKSLTIRATSCK